MAPRLMNVKAVFCFFCLTQLQLLLGLLASGKDSKAGSFPRPGRVQQGSCSQAPTKRGPPIHRNSQLGSLRGLLAGTRCKSICSRVISHGRKKKRRNLARKPASLKSPPSALLKTLFKAKPGKLPLRCQGAQLGHSGHGLRPFRKESPFPSSWALRASSRDRELSVRLPRG